MDTNETAACKNIRKNSMKEVDEVIDVLAAQFPRLSLEMCHQILDTAKEALTLLSKKGYAGISKPK